MRIRQLMMHAAVVVSILMWTVAVTTTGAQAPARTVNDGVYSGDQASRGQALFTSLCTTCHDTERFTGAEFVSAWSGKPLVELFNAVQTMPEDNPGSLSGQQYADVMAYFLQLNKFPTGADELKGEADALAGIQFEAAKP
jgi:mono/diheme cytochrome c family protein